MNSPDGPECKHGWSLFNPHLCPGCQKSRIETRFDRWDELKHDRITMFGPSGIGLRYVLDQCDNLNLSYELTAHPGHSYTIKLIDPPTKPLE